MSRHSANAPVLKSALRKLLFAILPATLVLAIPGRMLAQPADQPAIRQVPPTPPVSMIPLPARETIQPVTSCTSLRGKDFTADSAAPFRVTGAEVAAATSDRAEACVVKGYIAPQIHFQFWLPTTTFTGRYLQGGCGGNCGSIPEVLAPFCDNSVAYGGAFALGFEDSGHSGANGGDGLWAVGSPSARTDFAHRAAHVTAIAAKVLIRAYYGAPPRYSYFQGCSDGGREAMAEAQRHPGDFNGVIAGAAAMYITEAMERFLWENHVGRDANGQQIITGAAAATLHAAVMTACDGADGLQDGQIDDPRTCHFDPRVLVCNPGETQSCLTTRQAEVARQLYDGPRDAKGRMLYLGGEPYGSELTWPGPGSFTQSGRALAADFVRFMTFDNKMPAGMSLADWRFDEAGLRALQKEGKLYDADNPDLRPFRKSGGKLILWQGAADNAAGAYATLSYYQAVRDKVGGLDAARRFARVFMVPGVYHCAGGYVAYQEDLLGAMVRWVESGQAPDSVEATALLPSGKLRRRPVYAYPVKTAYRGGDVDDVASFAPQSPSKAPRDAFDWIGANPSHTR